MSRHTRRFMVSYFFSTERGNGHGRAFMNTACEWPASGLVPDEVIDVWDAEVLRLNPTFTGATVLSFIEIEPNSEES